MTARTMIQIARHPLAVGRAAARRAFTLIELMVAVGAVALIAVGLAAVFASVGDTVTGGRSVSGFTAYASLMERQLRDDIAKMSRDGFLLIVNQEARNDRPAGDRDVGLYPGQAPAQQRPRRVDEMVFFRKGDFTSGREPLGPGYTARGNSAMIYYGHGTRQPVDENVTSTYVRPRADDTYPGLLEPVSLGGGSMGGVPNPNRYASEWGLLRLQLALAGDAGSQRDLPRILGIPAQPPGLDPLEDSDVQVGAQPAARSLFRTLDQVPLPPAAGGPPTVRASLSENQDPRLISGLVDVVTSDLDEIRRSIISTPVDIGAGPGYQFETPADEPTDLAMVEHRGVVAPFAVQQAWMLDALPAPSPGFRAAAGKSWSPPNPYPPDWEPYQGDVRVRYEPAPPAYLEPMKLPAGRTLERAVRLADQMALTSPLLVPRCSEFIVEWSFGKVHEDGSLIWHGMRREVDLDGNGTPERHAARPYRQTPYTGSLLLPEDPANLDPTFLMPYRALESAPAGIDPFASEHDLYGSYPVSDQLIHGFENSGDEWTFDQGREVLVSFFGYMDPTFNPVAPGQPVGLGSSLPSGFPAGAALPSAADFLPWAWPELIRVTVSLADPADPAVEQTFQFVFEAPGNPAP